MYTSPHLSPEQRAERKAWAEQHVDDDWHAHVDIDEKWFYTLTRKRKRKVDPEWAEEGDPGRNPIPSKSHIPKVMFYTLTPDRDELAKVVEKTYALRHTARELDKLWHLKSVVLHEIIEAEGGNQYAMPNRIDKHVLEGAPTNRPC